MFQNIPIELRNLPQWVVWKLEKTDAGRPTKVPYNPVTFQHASSTDPASWVSYETAANAHAVGGWDGIGFVLSDSDPYTFIDLDDPYAKNDDGSPKHPDPAKIVDIQKRVYEAFGGTYAEISPSGTGLHIIAEGISPSGRRRHGVEMYSTQRFMTMTGNVYNAAPILERQAAIKWLYDEMGGAPTQQLYTGEYVDVDSDEVVIGRVLNAANGQKARDLATGNWQQHYASQSEADFALINIIAFYTKSVFQIVRLFRASALGQRDKASRDAYVLGMVQRSFDRMPPPLDIDALRNSLDAQFQREIAGGSNKAAGAPNAQPAHAQGFSAEAVTTAPLPSPQELPPPLQGDNPYLEPVPGLLGEIAYYIYDQAPRPVPEIALAGAIGLMAGICGRAYNVSGTGLNQYTLLLAGTGRGKEAIQSGISKLMAKVTTIDGTGGGCPAAATFVGPGDIASGQGLHKHLANHSNSFVSVIGEVDMMLKNLTSRNANAGMIRLKQILLQLYSVSGRGNVLGGTVYSEKEKNTASLQSPAFSMIGEGTPGRFYQLLDDAMVQDGLLPRFTVIEYDGERVPLNLERANVQPPKQLVDKVATLCAQALRLNQQGRPFDVGMTPEAEAFMHGFDRTVDGIINAAGNDTIEQLWNRAYLKAAKLAALIAVGCNYLEPTITLPMAEYAVRIVRHDTTRLVTRFNTGDVGEGMNKQMVDMKKAIKKMLNMSQERQAKFGISWEMARDKLISRRGLQQAVGNINSFKNDRMGTSRAFDTVVRDLIEGGVLGVVGPSDLLTRYGKANGRYYVVLEPSWLE